MPATDALKIVFAGTPDFAAKHLSALLASPHQVLSVYTQPDRPAGRGKKLHSSPVKQLALDAGIKVQQPISLKTQDAQDVLASYDADIMVVVAYGLLLPKAVLDTPKLGCINVHASLLPRWRGAAPIQRSIESGDTETGVTIMQMDVGLDTGDMLLIKRCPILADDTGGTLHDRLAENGPPALLEALDLIAKGNIQPQRQNHEKATYAHKLSKQEAQINWSQEVPEIQRRIRAFNPFPVATTTLAGERIRIHSASIAEPSHQDFLPGTIMRTGNKILVVCAKQSVLQIERMQLPGKKALTSQEILNGSADKFQAGFVFESAQTDDNEAS